MTRVQTGPTGIKERCFNWKKLVAISIILLLIIWQFPVWSTSERQMASWSMYPRQWIKAKDVNSAEQPTFSIVSYNILGQKYIRPGTYQYAPNESLGFEYRHSHLMIEMETINADIVFMQEVEDNYFKDLLKGDMNNLGYDCTVAIENTSHVGQATFWKKDKFKMLESSHYIFHELTKPFIMQNEKLTLEEKLVLMAAITVRNLIITTHLQHIPSGSKVILGDLHITWAGLRVPALQTLQIALSLQMLSKLSAKTGTKAIIAAGDFNTPPDYPGYDFIQQGSLTSDTRSSIKEKTNITGIVPQKYLKVATDFPDLFKHAFHHDLHMKSAYYTVQVNQQNQNIATKKKNIRFMKSQTLTHPNTLNIYSMRNNN